MVTSFTNDPLQPFPAEDGAAATTTATAFPVTETTMEGGRDPNEESHHDSAGMNDSSMVMTRMSEAHVNSNGNEIASSSSSPTTTPLQVELATTATATTQDERQQTKKDDLRTSSLLFPPATTTRRHEAPSLAPTTTTTLGDTASHVASTAAAPSACTPTLMTTYNEDESHSLNNEEDHPHLHSVFAAPPQETATTLPLSTPLIENANGDLSASLPPYSSPVAAFPTAASGLNTASPEQDKAVFEENQQPANVVDARPNQPIRTVLGNTATLATATSAISSAATTTTTTTSSMSSTDKKKVAKPSPSLHRSPNRSSVAFAPTMWPLVGRRGGNGQMNNSPMVCCGRLPDTNYVLSPQFRRRVRNFIQYSLLFFVVLILIIWLGAEHQDRKTRRAPSTAYLYNSSSVCTLQVPKNYNVTPAALNTTGNTTAATDRDVDEEILLEPMIAETFPSVEDVNAENEDPDSPFYHVPMHCQECGHCSNPQDIQHYDDTKNSLFETTLRCASSRSWMGEKRTRECMRHNTGFTDACTDCWVENIMCDLRKCIFTCLWHGLFSEADKSDNSKTLNRCTSCDEKLCGPQFVKCAGANRRRSGILSDIERDLDSEVCTVVEQDWWEDASLQEYYRKQHKQHQGAVEEEDSSLNHDLVRRRH